MKKLILILIMSIEFSICYSQTIYQKSLSNNDEQITDFIQLNDSSFYFVGAWRNCSGCPYLPILGLANSSFVPLWTYAYQDSAFARRVLLLDDGLVIFGTDNRGSENKYFLLKTDFNGIPLWSTSIGSIFNNDGVICKKDNGFLICGKAVATDSIGNDSTLLNIISVDDFGIVSWSRSYYITKYLNIEGIIYNSDSTFFVNFLLLNPDSVYFSSGYIKLSDNGAVLWSKNYSLQGKDLNLSTNPININNSFTCAGGVKINSTEHPFIFGINDTGKVELSVSFVRPGGGLAPYFMNKDKDYGNFIMTSGHGVIISDSLGGFIEAHSYIPNFPANSAYYKFIQLSDRGLLMCGKNTGGDDIFVVKTDSLYDGACGFLNVNFNSISENVSTSLLPVQEVLLDINNYPMNFIQNSLVLIPNIYCQTATPVNEIIVNDAFIISPNPVKDYFKIINLLELPNKELVIRIYSSEGRMVHSQILSFPSDQVEIRNLATGCYFVQIQSEKQLFYSKIMKL